MKFQADGPSPSIADSARDRLVDALRSHGSRVVERGDSAVAQCPAHEDRNPSLSVRGIEGQVLVYCHGGCGTDSVLAALDLTRRDLFDSRNGATYRYDDGRIVHRSPDKRFFQQNVTTIPELYRRAAVVAAVDADVPVYLVEGEKDVHALEAVGVVATTAPQGAQSIGKADLSPLHGGNITVVVDADAAGARWAQTVAGRLDGMVQSIRFVQAATGKDAADHIAAGHTLEDWTPYVVPEDAQEAAQETGSTWTDVDLAATVSGVLDGTLKRPLPTIGRIDGAGGLLYPGKVHGVHGIGGAGKTWLAACVIADCLKAGEHVLLVDLEDTAATIVERLLIDLQVPAEDVLARFHYKRPAEPSWHGMEQVHRTVTEHGVTLVVLDSVGEALAADGVRQNEDAEVATWCARVARSTADLGPAVLLLDHVPKADEKSLFPIGSQRKQAAMNGVIYSLQRKVAFSRDKEGMAVLVVGKDRQGTYAHGQTVAELRVTPEAGRSRVELVAPAETPKTADGGFRPTYLMERVSRHLEVAGPSTTNQITQNVTGKREAIIQAVGVLVAEGYVLREDGPNRSVIHSSVRPFRKDEEPGNHSVGDSVVSGSGSLRGGTGEPPLSVVPGTTGNHPGTTQVEPSNPHPDYADFQRFMAEQEAES